MCFIQTEEVPMKNPEGLLLPYQISFLHIPSVQYLFHSNLLKTKKVAINNLEKSQYFYSISCLSKLNPSVFAAGVKKIAHCALRLKNVMVSLAQCYLVWLACNVAHESKSFVVLVVMTTGEVRLLLEMH